MLRFLLRQFRRPNPALSTVASFTWAACMTLEVVRIRRQERLELDRRRIEDEMIKEAVDEELRKYGMTLMGTKSMKIGEREVIRKPKGPEQER